MIVIYYRPWQICMTVHARARKRCHDGDRARTRSHDDMARVSCRRIGPSSRILVRRRSAVGGKSRRRAWHRRPAASCRGLRRGRRRRRRKAVLEFPPVQHVVFYCHASANIQRRAFWQGAVIYDSGNPAFLLFGNEPVLLGPTPFRQSDTNDACGYSLHVVKNDVQLAMDALSSRNAAPHFIIQEFDLSQYANGIDDE